MTKRDAFNKALNSINAMRFENDALREEANHWKDLYDETLASLDKALQSENTVWEMWFAEKVKNDSLRERLGEMEEENREYREAYPESLATAGNAMEQISKLEAEIKSLKEMLA